MAMPTDLESRVDSLRTRQDGMEDLLRMIHKDGKNTSAAMAQVTEALARIPSIESDVAEILSILRNGQERP